MQCFGKLLFIRSLDTQHVCYLLVGEFVALGAGGPERILTQLFEELRFARGSLDQVGRSPPTATSLGFST